MTTRPTKSDKLHKLLLRPNGVTLNTICKATNWQPHSARAAISKLRKSGLQIQHTRTSNSSASTYRIVKDGMSEGTTE